MRVLRRVTCAAILIAATSCTHGAPKVQTVKLDLPVCVKLYGVGGPDPGGRPRIVTGIAGKIVDCFEMDETRREVPNFRRLK